MLFGQLTRSTLRLSLIQSTHLTFKVGKKLVLLCLFLVLFSPGLSNFATALEPIVIGEGQEKIDITLAGELYEGRGDSLQVETAHGADKIAGRMSVQATTPGTNPNWVVFALSNPTNKRIERWLTADRYSIINSGIFWSNLDANHITQVTPSLGFRPERIPNDDVDIFRIELEPRATVTFVAELSSNRFPRLYLWKARSFENKLRNITLFRGILLGVTGLLAVFLTAVFVANHKAVFPATALVAWAVTAYLCVDFGFWHKLFQLRPEDNAIYRAAAEASIAASIILFLYTFLRLSLWHSWIRIVFGTWLFFQAALIFFSIIDAHVAAGLARFSFILIAGLGSILIFYLAIRGQDRALSLVPSWLLFLVWLFACAVTIFGQVSGDIFVAGIVSGLVIIVLLFGFTVTQFAFRSTDANYSSLPMFHHSSIALENAGAAMWEWNAKRDEITVSETIEIELGLQPGTLTCPANEWVSYLHPADVERFEMLLSSSKESIEADDMRSEFRMRRSDNTYSWYELSVTITPATQYRGLKCVGIMRDITHTKRTQERLMHDAIYDSLTHLPNRELFLDRLESAITRTEEEGANRPIVIFIDIDRFKSINDNIGFGVGDTMLLTVARRLARHLSPLDTLARIGGDQFAIILITETEAQQIAMLAERVRRSLRSPMKIDDTEIILTGSIGISVFDGHQKSHLQLLREAEIAMHRAKSAGADRIEMFSPAMRNESDDRLIMEADLRRAIDKGQIKVFYQPIMYLENEDLAGFEAIAKWEHPRLGIIDPDDFIPIAEDTGVIGQLGTFVLDRASRQAAKWQKLLPRDEAPLFVNVNISSKQLFRHDLIKDLHLILKREILPKNSLRLSVAEAFVMENPEQAAEILAWLKNAGASLSLDQFGVGYSSLSYLHRFPFDVIKLHKSLVQKIHSERAAPAVVRSITALAHELGKHVAVEGISSQNDLSLLQSLRCEYVQGSYYGELLNEKDAISLINAVKKRARGRVKARKASRPAISSEVPAALSANAYQPLDYQPVTPQSSLPPQADMPPAAHYGYGQNSHLNEQQVHYDVAPDHTAHDHRAQNHRTQDHRTQDHGQEQNFHGQHFASQQQPNLPPHAPQNYAAQYNPVAPEHHSLNQGGNPAGQAAPAAHEQTYSSANYSGESLGQENSDVQIAQEIVKKQKNINEQQPVLRQKVPKPRNTKQLDLEKIVSQHLSEKVAAEKKSVDQSPITAQQKPTVKTKNAGAANRRNKPNVKADTFAQSDPAQAQVHRQTQSQTLDQAQAQIKKAAKTNVKLTKTKLSEDAKQSSDSNSDAVLPSHILDPLNRP